MFDRKAKLIIAFGLVYIIWGSTYLGIKFAIDSIPPFLMAGVRHIIAGLILFTYVKLKENPVIRPRHVRSNSIIGGLLLLGGNGGVVWAEQIVPSGLASLLVSTVPIWILLINWLGFQNDKPSLKKTAGLVLGLTGLMFLISPMELLRAEAVNPIGALVLMGASLSWAAGSVYTNYAPMPKSKFAAISIQMLSGGTMLLIWSFIVGEYKHFNIEAVTLDSIFALLYLIVFGSLIAYSAYIWLLHTAGPSLTSTYAYVNPVVAVFLGWLLASEPMNLRIIFSSVIIISAVALITTSHKKPSQLPIEEVS
ncbi:MAG: EamA family transporter [Ignavibacteriaceae bacterium]